MAFGHVKIKGISLGAAAVLFFAIALAAWAQSYDIELRVTPQLGTLGLTLFTFAIGINSGASFFHNLKTAVGPILSMVALYGITATVGLYLGKAMGMDVPLIAGTFAGSVTNTPALAAAGEASGDPARATVGYSIAYLFGVIGMLAASMAALHYGRNDKDAPSPLSNRTIRVERDDHPFVGDIYEKLGEKVSFSRLRRGETGPITRPQMSDTLDPGDLVTVVGPPRARAPPPPPPPRPRPPRAARGPPRARRARRHRARPRVLSLPHAGPLLPGLPPRDDLQPEGLGPHGRLARPRQGVLRNDLARSPR